MCFSSRGARLPRVLLGTHGAHKCTLCRQYTLVHIKIKSSFLNRLKLSGLDLPFPSTDTNEPHGAQCIFIRRIYVPASLAQKLRVCLRRAGSAWPTLCFSAAPTLLANTFRWGLSSVSRSSASCFVAAADCRGHGPQLTVKCF